MLDVARCLTLNASYEPVALVPVKRAIVLVVSEKAEIVEANLERRFRSERIEYPYPLVIRLVKYVEILRRLRQHGAPRDRGGEPGTGVRVGENRVPLSAGYPAGQVRRDPPPPA